MFVFFSHPSFDSFRDGFIYARTVIFPPLIFCKNLKFNTGEKQQIPLSRDTPTTHVATRKSLFSPSSAHFAHSHHPVYNQSHVFSPQTEGGEGTTRPRSCKRWRRHG